MLFEVPASRRDATAIDDGQRTRSWDALDDRVRRAARLWGALGVPAGGHAALLLGNRVELVELVLGAMLAGVTVTPVNWHLTAEEVAYILDDSGALVLVTEAALDPVARGAVETVARDVTIVSVGPELDGLLASVEAAAPDLAGPAGGTMFYTSGTTGRPKGVTRARQPTVAEQLASMPAAGRALGLDGRGAHLVTGPLYHAAPIGFALMDLMGGAPMVVMERFDAATTLDLISAHEVRNTHLVPTMFVRLLQLPDERRAAFDPSGLRLVLHGAAPISVPVKQRMLDWWGDVLVEYWGGSEGGVVTLVDAATWRSHPGTVGRPIPGHEVLVTDDDGREVPAGTDGVLWCRNLRVAEVFTYHGDPAKTAGAFSGPGTYTLGDIGHVDEDGFVYLADRASNMIISGGVNIYPAEVEQVLAEHPAVADIAVFGVPDEEWGERVLAVAELLPGNEPTPELAEAIRSFGRQHLAGFKVPRQVTFVDELPRMPSGKLATRRLKEQYWVGRDRRI